MTEAYVDLADDDFAEYLEVALKETFSSPGTADVTPGDRAKLKGLIAHYMKQAHPMTTCMRDQVKHGLSKDHAARRCAVLKDLGTGTTKWRGGDKKASEDGGEVEVFTLDVPEDWQEEFVRELADMSEPDDEPEVDEARGLFERFLAWMQGEEDDHASVALARNYVRDNEGKFADVPGKGRPDTPAQEAKRATAASPFEKNEEVEVETQKWGKITGRYQRTQSDGQHIVFYKGGNRVVAPDKVHKKDEGRSSKGVGGTGPNPLPGFHSFGAKTPPRLEDDQHEYDAFISPYLSEAAQEISLEGGKKLFWKQILPLGKRIEYRDGSYLKTDKPFLQKLADNINARTHPAPFNISRNPDAHSELADNAGGMIVGARLTERGLDVKIEPRTEEAEKFLTSFPECPVSAFYAEDYTDKGTGKKLGPRLFHVAATWRPYINEMSPAELVAASEEAQGAHIVDLSGGQYRTPDDQREEAEVLTETANNEETREEVQMSEQNDEQHGEATEQVISLEEFNSLKAELEEAKALAKQESRRRTRERTLSYLRDEYADVSEAGVQAAHRLLTTEWGDGEAAIQLSDDGVVSLTEGDNAGAARGGYVKTLLELARGSAPKLEEQGVDGATPGTGSNGEAKAKIKALSEEEGISEAEAEAKLFDQGVIR